MVKAQPTPEGELFLNPPNGSWGMFKAPPTPEGELFLNPPNGSWGMVKAQPSPHSKGLNDWRLDLNHPPTAVGGIRERVSAYVGWTLTIPQLPLEGFAKLPTLKLALMLPVPYLVHAFVNRYNLQATFFDELKSARLS